MFEMYERQLESGAKIKYSGVFFSRRFSKKNADYSSDFFFFKTNELTDFINFIGWPINTKLPLLPHYFTATLLHCHLA